MTDTMANGQISDAASPALTDGPAIRILTQFIRDLSFENPKAPESMRSGGAQPQIEMGIELAARTRDDGLYEVDLKLSAGAVRDGESVFHVELVYGALFQIEGVPAEEMEAVLLVECPRFLFPFARRIIADLSMEGGFPPLMLDPIDFAAIYMARKQQAQASEPATA